MKDERAALDFRIVEDRHGDPIAIIDGFPGRDASMSLREIEALRRKLSDIEFELRRCFVEKKFGRWP